ncbi:hypothetical protein T4E_3548, partial [Trichinella pseudospiralis]
LCIQMASRGCEILSTNQQKLIQKRGATRSSAQIIINAGREQRYKQWLNWKKTTSGNTEFKLNEVGRVHPTKPEQKFKLGYKFASRSVN